MDANGLIVLPRVHERHPDVFDDDVRRAWFNPLRSASREGTDPTQYIAVGWDDGGRLLEMCAVFDPHRGVWVVYHAMRATDKMMRELRLIF